MINLDEKVKEQPIVPKSASLTDLKEQQDAAQPAIQPDAQEIEPVRKQKYKKKEKKEEVPEPEGKTQEANMEKEQVMK